jgi:hypothetical protein
VRASTAPSNSVATSSMPSAPSLEPSKRCDALRLARDKSS